MMLCYLHAHAMNTVHPGTFQKQLIDSLKVNNLPTVILQIHNLPSQQIIQNIMPSEATQENILNMMPSEATQQITAVPEADLEDEPELTTDSEVETESETEDREPEQEAPAHKNNKKTNEIITQTGTSSNNDTSQAQALPPPPKQKVTTLKTTRSNKSRCNKRH